MVEGGLRIARGEPAKTGPAAARKSSITSAIFIAPLHLSSCSNGPSWSNRRLNTSNGTSLNVAGRAGLTAVHRRFSEQQEQIAAAGYWRHRRLSSDGLIGDGHHSGETVSTLTLRGVEIAFASEDSARGGIAYGQRQSSKNRRVAISQRFEAS